MVTAYANERPAPDAKRILVVEDQPDIRGLFEEVLRAAGYGVTALANGAAALSWLQKGEGVDAILLDLSMPVPGGEKFLSERRRLGLAKCVPVVVFSANTMDAPHDVAAVLRKSAEPEHVLAVVSAVIQVAPECGCQGQNETPSPT